MTCARAEGRPARPAGRARQRRAVRQLRSRRRTVAAAPPVGRGPGPHRPAAGRGGAAVAGPGHRRQRQRPQLPAGPGQGQPVPLRPRQGRGRGRPGVPAGRRGLPDHRQRDHRHPRRRCLRGGLAGIVEFAPDDTPRAVEQPGVASLPLAQAVRLLETVYGFAPELPDVPTDRLEFSIHPSRVGYRRSHTLWWELEPRATTDQLTARWTGRTGSAGTSATRPTGC